MTEWVLIIYVILSGPTITPTDSKGDCVRAMTAANANFPYAACFNRTTAELLKAERR